MRFSTCLYSTPKTILPYSHIPGPKGLPWIGNIWRYLPVIGNYKPDALFENAQFNRKHYGKLVREQLTAKHSVLHLFDPLDIEEYFRSDTKCPHRRSHRALLKYRHEMSDLYRDGGLFPENGPSWLRQRKQFQPRLMSKTGVVSNLQKIDNVTKRTVARVNQQAKVNNEEWNIIDDFDSHLYRWALGNALSIFIDLDIEHLDERVIIQIIDHLHQSLNATNDTEILSDSWIKEPNKCPNYQTLIEAEKFLYHIVSEQVDRVSNEKVSLEENVKYYLHQWIHQDKLDRLDIVTFCIDSLMAGLHTTSYTAGFLLFHLSENPQYQNLIRQSLSKNHIENNTISWDQLEKVILLKDCIKESMRLNPVSIGTGRLVSQEGLTLRNHYIPKGTMVITQNQVISRDEDIFEEPNVFKPERWTEYRSRPRHLRPSSFAFLPFGFGPRVCIGQRLAELQIKVLIVRLLQNFEVNIPNQIATKTRMIHIFDGNIKARFRKYSCSSLEVK